PGAALGLLQEAAVGRDGEKARTALIEVAQGRGRGDVADGVRAAAVRALAGVGGSKALNLARKALEDDDPEVAVSGATVLALLGADDDLDRLVGRRLQLPERQQARVDTAIRMLAARRGRSVDVRLPREDEKILSAQKKDLTIEAVAVPEGEHRAEAAWSALVPEKARTVGAFSCGPRTHVVQVGAAPEALAKAPAIAATLLGQNESTGESFVRWVVLIEPDGPNGNGGFNVTVARPTGEVGFRGTGKVDGEGPRGSVSVEIDAVEGPGASAVHVVARLSGGELQVEGVGDSVRQARLVPRKG
uniref:HEAT repeat domain-containing protein n=1 Tax=Nocardioides sp. TaxID=35761 RepID=UPI002B277F0C